MTAISSTAAPHSTSPLWDNRNRSFISPAELQQLRQKSPNRPDFHDFSRSPTQDDDGQQAAPSDPLDQPAAITSPQPRPGALMAGGHAHNRTSSFFSFRNKSASNDLPLQRKSQSQSPPQNSQPAQRPGTASTSTGSAVLSDTALRSPQLQPSKSAGPSVSPPPAVASPIFLSPGPSDQQQQPVAARRTSVGAQSALPPLHPEIRSVLQLTLAHARKVYFSGPLVRRIERQPDGQRPAKDEGWTEVWAQLGGTTLSIWDMREIDEANKQGKEVPPTYVNMTDAFVQVLGSVTVPPTQDQPAQKYTNVLTLNTAGSNLMLFSCPSTAALVSWAVALRLSAWEKSRLEEIYTAHLIRITLPDGKDTRTTLVRGRMEGWARIRIAGQTDWKRMWMVVQCGSQSSDAGNSSSTDGGRPTSPNTMRKKRMSDLFSRDHSTHSTLPAKPTLSLHASMKTKDKKKALLTMRNITQAFAMYPERPELINRSTLMKIEGLLGEEEAAGGMKGREAWLMVMPELEGSNTQAWEMLKWLVAFHDAFELYGRPKSYTWDPRDPVSMMFAYPVGPSRDLLFMDREVAESMDPREDSTSTVRSQLVHILYERMQGRDPRTAEQSSSDAPPSLPPIAGVGSPTSSANHGGRHNQLPMLPSLDFETQQDAGGRALSPITEYSVARDSPPDGRSQNNSASRSEDFKSYPTVPEAPEESTDSMLGFPFSTSPSGTPASPEFKHVDSPKPSEGSFGYNAGSRPDSKLTSSVETTKTKSTDGTSLSGNDAVAVKITLGATSPGSPNRSLTSPTTSTHTNVELPARVSLSSQRPASPPYSILTSPYSVEESRRKELPSIQGVQDETASPTTPHSPLPKSPLSFLPRSAASTTPAPPTKPTKQATLPSPIVQDSHGFLTDALLYMQQLDDKPKAQDLPPRRIPTTISEKDNDSSTSDNEYDTTPPSKLTEKKIEVPTALLASNGQKQQAPTVPAKSHIASQATRKGSFDTRPTEVSTSGTPSRVASPNRLSGARPIMTRRPSGARALNDSRAKPTTDAVSSSSPERRTHTSKPGTDTESMTDSDPPAPSKTLPTDDMNADALAALSFVENDSSQIPTHSPPRMRAQPTYTSATAIETPPQGNSPEAAPQFRSSFAPSKQAAQRKARAQAQQAASHAAAHRPGRANGKRTVSNASGGGWNDSSEEEEEEEEDDDDDDDADSDPSPSVPGVKKASTVPPAPNSTIRSVMSQGFGQSTTSPGDFETDVNSHLRPPRNLPNVPRPQVQDDYFSAQPLPRRSSSMLPEQQNAESIRRAQYDDNHLRPHSEFPQQAAARQSIWTQVLEPGRPHGPPSEGPPQVRDTFIQLESPSATMTKAFTPQGLLSAGLQDKQDRSAKRQEEHARETGASLINVPNKPPPPQTGLLGAITAHERERKREGGVGAALTEREREKRLAEERQRKLDDFQRQQLEMAQTGASMYGSPQFAGFNPMMANPMMMGMNPMMTGGYMGYPGMMPAYGNPQYMFAAQQAAQAAYQQAMMAFSAAGSQAGGDGMQGGMSQLNPMMTGGGMGGFDPRMSMMGMPIMPPMPMTPMSPMGIGMGGMGMQMTGTSAFDPRFSPSVMDEGLRPPGGAGQGAGKGSSGNSSPTPGPSGLHSDPPEFSRSPLRDSPKPQ